MRESVEQGLLLSARVRFDSTAGCLQNHRLLTCRLKHLEAIIAHAGQLRQNVVEIKNEFYACLI